MSDDFVFEGVEKRLEVAFRSNEYVSEGLRRLPRSVWDNICAQCKCTIVRATSLDKFDSYILSESSLFVFNEKIILKTCGTTVPLFAVAEVIRVASELHMMPDYVLYSHKNFLYPELQQYPHRQIDDEIAYLQDMVVSAESLTCTGQTAVLGPNIGSNWLAHRKQFERIPLTPQSCDRNEIEVTMDVMMTGLSLEVCNFFYKDKTKGEVDNEIRMTEKIRAVLPEFKDIAGKCYEPCGYSCNGHDAFEDESGMRYMTIHVTPEPAFSYASVETVFHGSMKKGAGPVLEDMSQFLSSCIKVFNPADITVSVVSNTEGVTACGLPHTIHASCSDSGTSNGSGSCKNDSSSMGWMKEKKTMRDAGCFIRAHSFSHPFRGDAVASSAFFASIRSGGSGRKPTGVL